jgi:hypothetical protein
MAAFMSTEVRASGTASRNGFVAESLLIPHEVYQIKNTYPPQWGG